MRFSTGDFLSSGSLTQPGPAADDDSGVVADVEPVGNRLLVEADAMGLLAAEPALVEEGFEFPVRRFGFGAQLQDQKRFHDPPQ